MLLGIAIKKLWFLRYLKALSFRYIEKRRNTLNESRLLPMCSDRYLSCLKEEKAVFSVLHIKVSFLKVFLVLFNRILIRNTFRLHSN